MRDRLGFGNVRGSPWRLANVKNVIGSTAVQRRLRRRFPANIPTLRTLVLSAFLRSLPTPSQVSAGRNVFGAVLPVLVAERKVPGRMQGHEVEHPAGELVVMDACVSR